MEPITTVHLMRHGEVDNPRGVLYGRMPGFGLTPLGGRMAQCVADTLGQLRADISYVVASPLLRAQLSALPAARRFDLAIETDPRLIEAGNSFEGEQVNATRWALAAPRYWPRYVNPARPSWGEPYDRIALRMRDAVRCALAHARGHEALVVSHQLPIWCLRLFIEGRPFMHLPASRECSLCSLTSLTFAGSTLTRLTYWEPAGKFLSAAEDMVPGTSSAAVKQPGSKEAEDTNE